MKIFFDMKLLILLLSFLTISNLCFRNKENLVLPKNNLKDSSVFFQGKSNKIVSNADSFPIIKGKRERNIGTQEVDLPSEVRSVLYKDFINDYSVDEDAIYLDKKSSKFKNIKQNFSSYFQSGKLIVAPTLENRKWLFEMRFENYGWSDQVAPVGIGNLSFNENRAEIDYGSITEWYVNRPSGLEHGYTIYSPPPGEGDSLIFQMEVETDLIAHVQADNLGIVLKEEEEAILNYSGLFVEDAIGNKLPAKLSVENSLWTITVSKLQNAQYPITVDPNIFTIDILTASDGGIVHNFGSSVDMEGDTLVVGAANANGNTDHSGAVYIFEFIGGKWMEADKLIAFDGASWDNFGRAVAIHGDWIAVGAYAEDSLQSNSGAVYIFNKNKGHWSYFQKLNGIDVWDAFGRNFGWSLDMSGNRLVIGAPYQKINSGLPNASPGAVYIYEISESNPFWTFDQMIFSNLTTIENELFGYDVAISGKTLIVGASNHGFAGAAYVFNFSNHLWSLDKKLLPNNVVTDVNFGFSVDINAERALVSSTGNTGVSTGTLQETGAVYVYKKIGNSFIEEDKIIPDDIFPGVPAFGFGYSVSLLRKKVYITARSLGSPWVLFEPFPQDAIYEFTYDDSAQWLQTNKFIDNNLAKNSLLGTSLTASGDMLVAGTPLSDDLGNGSGSVYVWNLDTQPMISK